MKLISACLVGINCKYDGGNNLSDLPEERLKEYKDGKMIPVCPELFGGFSIPRYPAQIKNGDGNDILAGKERVITNKGEDVTEKFIKGAREVLSIAKDLNIKEAILKQRSPSCGCGQIHDGSFTKIIKRGDGVTAALLKNNGVKIKTEEDFV